MNKKLLMFGIMFVALASVFVTAGIITNWFHQDNEFNVGEILQTTGETFFEANVIGGDLVVGESFTTENIGSVSVEGLYENDAEEGINVEYYGELIVAQKNVNFDLNVWTLKENGETAIIKYKIVGDEFTAEVTEGFKEGYTLIYYKDNSNRFVNPAQGILIENTDGNLPYETDGNTGEYNYCDTQEYLTCHGAKLWYIPETALSEGNIDWSQADDFLFETKLIQFNKDGKIVFYQGTSIEVTPEFEFSVLLSNGQYNVSNEVNPITEI